MRWCGFWTCLRIQKSRYQRERERDGEEKVCEICGEDEEEGVEKKAGKGGRWLI